LVEADTGAVVSEDVPFRVHLPFHDLIVVISTNEPNAFDGLGIILILSGDSATSLLDLGFAFTGDSDLDAKGCWCLAGDGLRAVAIE
tara:strand:- start:181 stop:441 length:261 start_codon:yes stop_codon:yes gene_type:complete